MADKGFTEDVQTISGEIAKLAIGIADLKDVSRPARLYLVEMVFGRIADAAAEGMVLIASRRKEQGGDIENENGQTKA